MADFHNNKPKRKKVCFMCIGKDVNYKDEKYREIYSIIRLIRDYK